MTVDELLKSAQDDSQPPDSLSDELQSLWHIKAGNWEAAHNIAQDIPSVMGSWLHALLHVIEGDMPNAGYWYRKAARPSITPDDIDSEWRCIASELLGAE